MQPRETSSRSLTPAQLLIVLLLAIALLLIPLLYLNLLFGVLDDLENKKWGGADFTAYYTAARLIRQGESPYDEVAFWREAESLGFGHDRPYIYFPLLAISMVPLTLLPPAQAAAIWFCLNVALPPLSALLMVWTLGLQRHKTATVALLLAILVFYPAVFSAFMGQSNALLLALLVLAWYLVRRGSDELAGVAIAAASLIKVFPFVVALYFLWKGKYRLFLCTLAALVVFSALSMAIVGLEPHVTYVSSVLPTQLVKPHPLNQSLSAFLVRALRPDGLQSVVVWRLVSLLVSVVVLVGTLLLIRRRSLDEEVIDLELSLVVVSMLLVSTVSWIGTLTLLVIPYVVVTKVLGVDESWRRVRFLSITLLLSFLAVNAQRPVETYVATGSRAGPLPSFLLSMPTYGMILLWLAIAYLLLRRRESPLFALRRS